MDLSPTFIVVGFFVNCPQENGTMNKEDEKKYKQLGLAILFDAIGMFSYAVPLLGDLSDIVWAPLAGYLMTRMFKGKVGQIAGVVAFVEEIIPG